MGMAVAAICFLVGLGTVLVALGGGPHEPSDADPPQPRVSTGGVVAGVVLMLAAAAGALYLYVASHLTW